PDGIELLVATKYLATSELAVLAQAGVKLVGENQVQSLQEKFKQYGDLFKWDFIGHLQSRKVKQVLPLVRFIHSVWTESVLEQLKKYAHFNPKIFIEVNISGEQ